MLWKGLLFLKKDKGVSNPGMDKGAFLFLGGKGKDKDFNSVYNFYKNIYMFPFLEDLKKVLPKDTQELKSKDMDIYILSESILQQIKADRIPDLEDLMISLEILTRNMPSEVILDRFRPLSEKNISDVDNLKSLKYQLQEFVATSTFINDGSKENLEIFKRIIENEALVKKGAAR
jgi:hypothetical protein